MVQVLEMVSELFHEIRVEIAANPTTIIIEVVQFVILIAIVWVVAIGVGKRSGLVKNMLKERRVKIASDLGMADGSEAALESAKQKAVADVAEAQASAKKTLTDARRKAKAERTAGAAAADREAEALRDHAQQLLVMEHQEMLAEARERLLEVVGSATRHILSERISPAEQRALVQRAIMTTIEGAETVSPQQSAEATA